MSKPPVLLSRRDVDHLRNSVREQNRTLVAKRDPDPDMSKLFPQTLALLAGAAPIALLTGYTSSANVPHTPLPYGIAGAGVFLALAHWGPSKYQDLAVTAAMGSGLAWLALYLTGKGQDLAVKQGKPPQDIVAGLLPSGHAPYGQMGMGGGCGPEWLPSYADAVPAPPIMPPAPPAAPAYAPQSSPFTNNPNAAPSAASAPSDAMPLTEAEMQAMAQEMSLYR